MRGTLAELANYIQAHCGDVVAAIVLSGALLLLAAGHQSTARTNRNRVISDGAPNRLGGPQYPVPRLT